MKYGKKLLVLLTLLAILVGMAACGTGGQGSGSSSISAADPDSIPDTMTSADGTYQIAFVTDVGQLKDESFNQATYDGVKLFADGKGLSYKYYQLPRTNAATDDERYNTMKQAVSGGANVVVAAGYMQEEALKRIAAENPKVQFVFIDGYPVSDEAGDLLTNVAGICFDEHRSGYFAGYAAVMEGYTKLGFCGGGGGTNDACCRYGYGYVQGANAAAAKLNVQVEVNYSWAYGEDFEASDELTALAKSWYDAGTQIIFSCGGAMIDSVVQAAEAKGGKVIGVDVDQSSVSDCVVTSATKGLADAVRWALAKCYDGSFDSIGGAGTALGVKEQAVGLPTASWSMKKFTIAQYEELFRQMQEGTVPVDSDFTALEKDWSNLKLSIV